MTCVAFSIEFAETNFNKVENCRNSENYEICENYSLFYIIFHYFSFVSLVSRLHEELVRVAGVADVGNKRAGEERETGSVYFNKKRLDGRGVIFRPACLPACLPFFLLNYLQIFFKNI